LGAGGIEQGIAERSERRAGLADPLDQFKQLTGRSTEPVELGHTVPAYV
jgi:hypothetical protein